jgi:hypothetical protein
MALVLSTAALAASVQEGSTRFSNVCSTCHADDGTGDIGPSLIGCSECGSYGNLQDYIHTNMPNDDPTSCQGICSWNAAAYVWQSLNGNSKAEYEVFLPHATRGDANWNDVIEGDNKNTASQATYQMTLYDQGSIVHDNQHTVSAGGYANINQKLITQNYTIGRYNTLSQDLHLRIAFEYASTGSVAGFDLNGSTGSTLHFYFSNFASFVEFKSIAIMNASPSQVQVTIEAFSGGSSQGTTTETIGAWDRVSGAHTKWFPSLSTNQVERIKVTSSSSALKGISITGSSDLTRLLFFPAEIE